jgi:hypothetical protein
MIGLEQQENPPGRLDKFRYRNYRIPMRKESEIERVRRRSLRRAEGKLRDAKIRLARNERSIVYWSRKVADLRHERIRAVQPPLWPEEETHE